MTRKYFGTDGIRGEVGKYPMTPDFILKLGWAAGRVLSKRGKGKAIIGKDTRISGYMYESALEAGLASAGIDSLLLGPIPTPGIAYLTRTLRAQLGIVISASHNPFYDNGIKFFSEQGLKLSDEIELEIEKELDGELQSVDSSHLGRAKRVVDAQGRYIEFCKSILPRHSTLGGMKIILDCAHGAGYLVAPNVFRELGADVIAIGNEPDGLNINSNVGSTQPEVLSQQVISHQADVGIALDGDGDRLIMVDHMGEIIDGDEIIYMIACHYKEFNDYQGGVVGTLMSNLGLEIAIKALGLDFVRAKVGDRYVHEQLAQHQWLLGGEGSGHIICLDKSTTGDGIIAALQVLFAMLSNDKNLKELKSGMTKFPQKLINVRTENRVDPFSSTELSQLIKEAEKDLAGRGRVLLRNSGTEPLIRVMVEGENETQVTQWCEQIATKVKQLFA